MMFFRQAHFESQAFNVLNNELRFPGLQPIHRPIFKDICKRVGAVGGNEYDAAILFILFLVNFTKDSKSESAIKFRVDKLRLAVRIGHCCLLEETIAALNEANARKDGITNTSFEFEEGSQESHVRAIIEKEYRYCTSFENHIDLINTVTAHTRSMGGNDFDAATLFMITIVNKIDELKLENSSIDTHEFVMNIIRMLPRTKLSETQKSFESMMARILEK